MDDLNSFILTWACIFGIFQLEAVLINLIKWAVRRKHPAQFKEVQKYIKDPSYQVDTTVWE